jgi:hypothetical protein
MSHNAPRGPGRQEVFAHAGQDSRPGPQLDDERLEQACLSDSRFARHEHGHAAPGCRAVNRRVQPTELRSSLEQARNHADHRLTLEWAGRWLQ